MDQDKILRKRLNSLIEKDLLSSDVLTKATCIEKNVVENYLLGKCNVLSENDMEHCKRKSRLASITDCLMENKIYPVKRNISLQLKYFQLCK